MWYGASGFKVEHMEWYCTIVVDPVCNPTCKRMESKDP
jgi:hypothetical protein